MTHKIVNGNAIVDWTTGDPEGDRANLFKAYRAFLKEVKKNASKKVLKIFDKWNVGDLNIDDFPRISIAYPEEKK
jgi:hypothetical protein